MNQTLLSSFGTPFERVENALAILREGHDVMVLDDEDRENEDDMIFLAEIMTVGQIALTIRHGSDIICLCITGDCRRQLDLPMMAKDNTSAYGTGFTVTIEATGGVTTGVSAADRITTVRTAIADDAKPFGPSRPDHVFLLCIQAGGILMRGGHTEAITDLVTLVGFKPTDVSCELTNDDGMVARVPECIGLASKHNMALVIIEDLVAYRQVHERKVSRKPSLSYCPSQETEVIAGLGSYSSLLCKMLTPFPFP